MSDKTSIIEIVYSAIDTVTEELADDEKVTKSPNTLLFGKGAELDSMLFINLIVALEELIAERFEEEIVLAFEEEMYAENPRMTVEDLAEYIAQRLEESSGG